MPQAVSPLALLQVVAQSLPEECVAAALAGRKEALLKFQDEKRRSDCWTASVALEFAHLWLVAGHAEGGDELVLEAQELLPQVGVVPDWWGLWPSCPELNSCHGEVVALAKSYIQLRHLPPLEAWTAWLEPIQADRSRCGEAALQLLLALVVSGRAGLPGTLEPVLEQLIGEDFVAAEPALAWRLLDPLCERLPQWNYARLKAADLSLQRGELERCGQHLEQAAEEQWQLFWLQDIAARHALAKGNVAHALEFWKQAISLCRGGESSEQEIFRQRAQEARRGAGVLQARSLFNRGLTSEALELLDLLLEQDPQWQPLRSLLDQVRGSGSEPQSVDTDDAASDLERLERVLKKLANQAQLSWPPNELPPSRDASAAEEFVQGALGRLALLS